MNVLVTGSASGIGKKTAEYFLQKNFDVYGLDRKESTINNEKYNHFVCDVANEQNLPELPLMEIIFCNAGTQNDNDMKNNLMGSIAVAEKYALKSGVKSVLFNASASAITGSEFPLYAASKAGVVGYMKNLALRLAKRSVTVNALCLGGVLTESNKPVMEDKTCWEKIMAVTPMGKWMTEEEVAEWVYFLTVVNKSMTGEVLLIDNGEGRLNQTFIWK